MGEVLLEQPKNQAPGYRFGDSLTLNDWLIAPTVTQGATLHVDLWWSALKTLPLDYSTGVFLQDQGGTIVAQSDAPPGEQPTSQWLPDQLKFDRHNIAIPGNLPPGEYKVGAHAYWYGDKKR